MSELAAKCQTVLMGPRAVSPRRNSRQAPQSFMSSSRKPKLAFDSACDRLARLPKTRLSKPTTRPPSDNKRSTKWLPIKPAAPVTKLVPSAGTFADIGGELKLIAHRLSIHMNDKRLFSRDLNRAAETVSCPNANWRGSGKGLSTDFP